MKAGSAGIAALAALCGLAYAARAQAQPTPAGASEPRSAGAADVPRGGPDPAQPPPPCHRSGAIDLAFEPEPGLCVRPALDVIAQYVASFRKNADGDEEWFHAFELTRAHVALGASYEGAEARAVIEAVRSSEQGSLLGVAGDSFVFRVREALARYTVLDTLAISAGVVPTLTLPPIERAFASRAVGANMLEWTGLASPADLGASARGIFPEGYGWVGVGAYNGEGYAQSELNRGKNVEIAAEVHPFAFSDDARPLAITGSYMAGSSGTGLARADRANVALVWMEGIASGGVATTYGIGVGDRGSQRTLVVDAFAHAEPVPELKLAARFGYWIRDLDADARDALAVITGAVGYCPVAPIEAYVALDRVLLSDVANAALPGEDQWKLRVIAHSRF